MKNLLFTFSVIILGLISSCGSYTNHITSAYHQKARPNSKLAIVPVRYKYTGAYTKKMTDEQRTKLEEQESKQFQNEIASGIVRKMGKGDSEISVILQDVNSTNAKLKKKGFSIHDTYEMSPSELGNILNVDAIILVEIESDQFFSDFEAEVVETGVAVVKTIFKQSQILDLGWIATGEIQTHATIIDTKDEVILWSVGKEIETRVSRTPKETIDKIKRKIVHLFPYRNHDFKKK